MCGRYYIDDDTSTEIEKLVREIQGELSRETAAALQRIQKTDIHPAAEAPVLLAAGGRIGCAWLRWGFPLQQDSGKGLVFNARCESAAEKNLFREGIRHRRIIVPATAFYEWDQQKTKYVHLSCHLEQKPGTESREVHVDIAKPPYYNNVC